MDLLGWRSATSDGLHESEAMSRTCDTFYILQKEVETLFGEMMPLPPRAKTFEQER